MSLKKTGAEALDEIVLGMTASPVDRVHQLLKQGRASEAAQLVDQLSVDEIMKLAQDLEVQVSQSEDEASPPTSTVDSEHDKEENTSKGEPHAGEPAKEEAEINEVGGDEGKTKEKAPDQIEEKATPPASTKDIPKNVDPPEKQKGAAEGEDMKEDESEDEKKEDGESKSEDAKTDGDGSEDKAAPKKEEDKVAFYRKRIVEAYIKGAEFRANQIKSKISKGGK